MTLRQSRERMRSNRRRTEDSFIPVRSPTDWKLALASSRSSARILQSASSKWPGSHVSASTSQGDSGMSTADAASGGASIPPVRSWRLQSWPTLYTCMMRSLRQRLMASIDCSRWISCG